jgi:phthalate 4,5-dioxygenase oxygenase subunit
MGEAHEAPPLPTIEANLVDESEIWRLQRACNWLQALDGDIDTSHVGFLHVGSLKPDDLSEDHPMRPMVFDRAPEYSVASTPWGTMYGGYRPNDDGLRSWRVVHFMFPFWTQTPNNRFASRAIARAWVPMDDQHSMLFDITCGVDEGNPAYVSRRKTGEPLFKPFQYAPNTTDWFGRWRSVDDARNDWGIDREVQRNGGQFTGIANITMQDQAVTESMGPIVDYAYDHLAPTAR